MKSFTALIQHTKNQLVEKKTGKHIHKTANTIKLINANKRLLLQNQEKEDRAAELIVANIELQYQNQEKENRAAELIVANIELQYQNQEKEKRAAELIIANNELQYQNQEKEKRAAELIVANIELQFQNQEKEKRAAELIIANKELVFQKIEKIKKSIELTFVSKELKKAEKYQKDYVNGLNEMMFITSHNVRLPLANIIGISEFLNQIDNTPEEINLCIAHLKQSALLLETSTKELAFYITNLEQSSKNLQW